MTEFVKKRQPVGAALLSLVVAGLGQLYNGQLKRALTLFAIVVLGYFIAISPFFHSYQVFFIYSLGLMILLAVKVFAAIDAFIGARRIGKLELQRFNRWYVYVSIWLVVGLVFDAISPKQSFHIPSGAMKPTLLVGDLLVVNKHAYQSRDPERGDVAVFKKPSDNETDYIKRLVGLPGDRIQVVGGVLHINGEAVPREKIGETTDRNLFSTMTFQVYRETLPNGRKHLVWEASDTDHLDNTPEYLVPEGHFFFLGDNRDNSRDSRVLYDVGYVPFENLVGPVAFLYFSYDDTASWWQVWRWPQAIRFDRIGNLIN